MPTRLEKQEGISFQNQRGFGLVAAVFLIVVVSMFGVLIARYVATTSISSAEDYISAQSLYSARSAAALRILYYDGGGGGAWGGYPTMQEFSISSITDTAPVASGTPEVLRLRATSNKISGISRDIEIKYIL